MSRLSPMLLAAGLTAAAPALGAAPPAMPKGPINVTSQRFEMDEQGRVMLYRGKVRMTRGELELKGERLELREPAAGVFEVRISGRPARLSHPAQGDGAPLAASAELIVYDTRAATLNLNGGATLSRGGDVLTGERISYDLSTRRISAAGGEGEQIRFVIQPPKDEEAAPPAPADAEPPR